MNPLYSKSNAVNLKQGQRNVFLFGAYVYKDQRHPTGGPQVIAGPKLLVIRPAKLFVNLFLFTYYKLIYFLHFEGFEKSVAILILSAALR
jgi:hypothetical protein